MRRIILSGGSGFHTGDAFAHITDRWLVEYTRNTLTLGRPLRALFIGTARGEDESGGKAFHDAFKEPGCETSTLQLITNTIELGKSEDELFAMSESERRALGRAKVRERILSQDLIVVGGGNTDLLLYMLRRHEIVPTLRHAYDSGTVLFGPSAGGIYPTIGGTTDSFHVTALEELDHGLGWLKILFNPHHQHGLRRKMFQHMVTRRALASGEPVSGYAADDGVSLVFEDDQFVQAVSDRAGAFAYRVVNDVRSETVETRLPTRLLAP